MNKYFKGIVKCALCQKNFNYRNERGNKILLCSNRKNFGVQACPDSPRIKLDDLVYIIKKHCEIHNKDYDITKTKLFVKNIQVSDKEIVIYYKDGTKSVWSNNEMIF